MFRFTIRDVLWLTVVVALIAVWKTDLARQEAVYRDMLKSRYVPDEEFRDIRAKAMHNPELWAELIALSKEDAQFSKQSLAEKRLLHQRYMALRAKARDLPSPPAALNHP